MTRAAVTTLRGPTVATLREIEAVLRTIARPMTRYGIRKALGNRIAQPLLDEALAYLADHKLVFDEGPGGRVVWIATSERTAKRLRE